MSGELERALSEQLAITAEWTPKGTMLLIVEHGNGDRLQMLELLPSEMQAAASTVQAALDNEKAVTVRYPHGLSFPR